MALVVSWTDTAIEKLENIFDYYKTKVSIQVAQNIVGSIVESTIILETHPTIGQVEELLKNRKNEYRYLVTSNYKIIYWITDSYVLIATVFDCRQNPKKIKKIK
jgi:plasmid stabilization system protein ParE